MRINGRRVWGTYTRVEFFTGSGSRRGERTERPFDPNGDMRCTIDDVKSETIYRCCTSLRVMFSFTASSCRCSGEGKVVRAYTLFKNCSGSACFLHCLDGEWSEEVSDTGGWCGYGEAVVCVEIPVSVRSTEAGSRWRVSVDGMVGILIEKKE